MTEFNSPPPEAPDATGVRVAVLMATYNGADCIEEQLESICRQSRRPDLILVSDDGSIDFTPTIIERFSDRNPACEIRLLPGPRKGSARNFLSLIERTPDDIDMVFFSDQDDVWLPGKIARGIARLETSDAPDGTPLLYCARVWECDENLRNWRCSRPLRHAPSFRNALVQNVASGNTILLNRTALELARRFSGRTRRTVVHDWWLYQIVTGTGGRVLYDPEPVLLYRQHRNNLIGANRGVVAAARRLRAVWTGRFRLWTSVNIHALRAVQEELTPQNATLLLRFAAARRASVMTRLLAIRRLGLYRQGRVGQASLYLAALLGRL